MSYTNDTISYTISATNGLFFISPGGNQAITVNEATDDIQVSLTGGVTMAGGIFAVVNGLGAQMDGNVVVTFSDGAQVTAASPAFIGRFAGSTNTLHLDAIHSATQDGNHFVKLNHFYVSKMEPGNARISR